MTWAQLEGRGPPKATWQPSFPGRNTKPQSLAACPLPPRVAAVPKEAAAGTATHRAHVCSRSRRSRAGFPEWQGYPVANPATGVEIQSWDGWNLPLTVAGQRTKPQMPLLASPRSPVPSQHGWVEQKAPGEPPAVPAASWLQGTAMGFQGLVRPCPLHSPKEGCGQRPRWPGHREDAYLPGEYRAFSAMPACGDQTSQSRERETNK